MSTPAPLLSDDTTLTLPFTEANPDQSTTILLIHGALSNRDEWNLVTPHLRNYHLLIPDLPGHGSASHLRPFTTLKAARLLANTIHAHAKNRRAHIIGLSLGAYIAIDLATTYSATILSLFISGIKILPILRGPWVPYLMYLNIRLETLALSLAPKSLVDALMSGTDVHTTATTTASFALCREILYPISLADTYRWPGPWKARTLIVCAGKSGVLPTSDSEADTVRMVGIAREGNPESRAVVHREMRHPWNRQRPEVFAEAARAWFEGTELPEGFEELQ
ncbi:hypothetical protein B0A50_06979 [Salinomyces thailandicus]|uniref:AB hydrolase-1 domain-containing protein n=1 Tax=Salinomyces thailandicus TaxID=706561 RepID=A0A4U0TP84_9PEZI|nr:hypothetical protein B0A50_06979 [Salinomyces thailandica]